MAIDLRDTSPAPAPPPTADTERHQWRHLLRILSPGLITGAADDDPSGIADCGTLGDARSGWLSPTTLTLIFVGMAGSVVATALSYIKG